ncbi:MAG: methyltransferase, TrmH family, partial [Acidobacteriota bacterium]|nr:methyltransferase, TrmH family [Acidobacteriota bacterium]
MSDPLITSRDNSILKRARAVRDGKAREQIFIEGLRLCEEAVRARSNLEIVDIICTEHFVETDRGEKLLDELSQIGKRPALVRDSLFSTISDTKTPQGIVILAVRPSATPHALLKDRERAPLLVILCRINNPSNAGAIVRAAEAASATGVIVTEGSSDIYSPKALRGSMGSSFRLPSWTDIAIDEVFAFCREHGIRTICTDLSTERSYTEIDWTGPCALLLGPEASGLEREEIARSDETVRIPMQAPVESLNVAVAAGIVLYEAARQRAERSG